MAITAPRPMATTPGRNGWPPRPRRSAPMSRSRNSPSSGSTPVAAFLEIGGERIPAIPAFDAPPPTATASAAGSGRSASDAEIAVAELPPQAVYSGEYERLRRVGGHRGFVILCAGQSPGMALAQCREVPRAVRHADDPRIERGARHRARGRGRAPPGPARLREPPHASYRPQHRRLARCRRHGSRARRSSS